MNDEVGHASAGFKGRENARPYCCRSAGAAGLWGRRPRYADPRVAVVNEAGTEIVVALTGARAALRSWSGCDECPRDDALVVGQLEHALERRASSRAKLRANCVTRRPNSSLTNSRWQIFTPPLSGLPMSSDRYVDSVPQDTCSRGEGRAGAGPPAAWIMTADSRLATLGL